MTQIPNFVYVLLHHPDRLAAARADPRAGAGRGRGTVRYVPLGVGSAFARYAMEDVEVGGVLVRAGEPVLGSTARRIGTVRLRRPGQLRLDREQNPHMGFGHGVHHCVGRKLARMELQVAVARPRDPPARTAAVR